MNKKLKETLEVELSIAEYALIMNNPTVTRIIQVCSDFCDEHFAISKTHKELQDKCDELQEKCDELQDKCDELQDKCDELQDKIDGYENMLSQIRSLAG